MKNLSRFVIGFLIFNCLSIVAIAACASSVTVNGATCPFDRESPSFCYYRCPSGEYRGNKGGEEGPPIVEGPQN